MNSIEKKKPKRNPTFENVREIFDRVKVSVKSRTQEPEFLWGIESLDRITHGVNRGKVSILAARTSEGKTTMAIQTAVRNADMGKLVAYISLEDDREQLVEKIFCQITGTNNQELKRGHYPDAMDNPTVNRVMEQMKLLIVDQFGYSFQEIRAVIEDIEPKPDMLIIDYIQIIEGEANQKRFEVVSEFIRMMQTYTKKENIATVIISQINRKGAQDGRPRLHHLADSGTLEQAADVVVLLYLPWKYNDTSYDFQEAKDGKKRMVVSGMEVCPPDYLEIEVAKNKTGPIGVATSKFKKSCYQIEQWDGQSEADA